MTWEREACGFGQAADICPSPSRSRMTPQLCDKQALLRRVEISGCGSAGQARSAGALRPTAPCATCSVFCPHLVSSDKNSQWFH